MKADPKVIELLNEVLTSELTAINQYFLHAEMCENWGYRRLHQKIRSESIEEMKHAEKLVHRVLFLDGLPNLQRLGKIDIGETVPEIFRSDLALELEAVQRLNAGIEQCRVAGDNGTRELLEHILKEEEEHVDWVETQLEAMKQVGEQAYLAEQLKEA
jgi:bacterioferritin